VRGCERGHMRRGPGGRRVGCGAAAADNVLGIFQGLNMAHAGAGLCASGRLRITQQQSSVHHMAPSGGHVAA
jgi:hypothetical protein